MVLAIQTQPAFRIRALANTIFPVIPFLSFSRALRVIGHEKLIGILRSLSGRGKRRPSYRKERRAGDDMMNLLLRSAVTLVNIDPAVWARAKTHLKQVARCSLLSSGRFDFATALQLVSITQKLLRLGVHRE
jgi:hypothetical protein